MSPVAAGLDGLLALLLVAALVLGMRLNARLKTLRDSQAGFAAAVIELNTATARAEAGLSALKTAQESAHEDLLGRIEVARDLVGRLERAGADAERRIALAPQRAAEPAAPSPAPAPRVSDGPAAGSALAAIAALAEGRSVHRPAPAADPASVRLGSGTDAAGPGPFARPPRRAPARGVFDEELFAAPVARRDDPLGTAALERGPSERGALERHADRAPPSATSRLAPAASPATQPFPAFEPEPLDLGPLADPLSKWKTVR